MVPPSEPIIPKHIPRAFVQIGGGGAIAYHVMRYDPGAY